MTAPAEDLYIPTSIEKDYARLLSQRDRAYYDNSVLRGELLVARTHLAGADRRIGRLQNGLMVTVVVLLATLLVLAAWWAGVI